MICFNFYFFNVHSVHFNVHENVHTPSNTGEKILLFRVTDNIYYIISTLSMYMYCTCTSIYKHGIFWRDFFK